jgi:hypothetical protein
MVCRHGDAGDLRSGGSQHVVYLGLCWSVRLGLGFTGFFRELGHSGSLKQFGPWLRRAVGIGHSQPHPAHGDDTESREHDGGCDADGFHRQLVGDPVTDEYGRDIRQHHAERRAQDHEIKSLKARRERHGRNLRLVANFSKEERDEGCGECPCATDRLVTALTLLHGSATVAGQGAIGAGWNPTNNRKPRGAIQTPRRATSSYPQTALSGHQRAGI